MVSEHNVSGHFISCNIFFQLVEKYFLFALQYFYGSKVCLHGNIEPLFYLLVLMEPYDFYRQLENDATVWCVKQNYILHTNDFSQWNQRKSAKRNVLASNDNLPFKIKIEYVF